MKNGWHITVDGDVLTLARRLPVRMDICAATDLPDGNRAKVAQQVRQDMWRALQGLRGFSPVVQVTRTADGLNVRAGGQVDGAVPAGIEAAIADVLDDPKKRARWVRFAAARRSTITNDEGRADPRGGASRRAVVQGARLRQDLGGSARPGVDAGRDADQHSSLSDESPRQRGTKGGDEHRHALETVQGRGHR
ncbi:hypothetical protein [Chachezhania sediminis]|uniref:hypothetical protein n=1 Tax=Chachezhania sediminis TaxID=2599291 RepID=UPI001E63B1A8|nr:hypothetical protein [Chachezhania sediminis]